MGLLLCFILGFGVKMFIIEFQLFSNLRFDNLLIKKRYIDYLERQIRLKNFSKILVGRLDRGVKKVKDS